MHTETDEEIHYFIYDAVVVLIDYYIDINNESAVAERVFQSGERLSETAGYARLRVVERGGVAVHRERDLI